MKKLFYHVLFFEVLLVPFAFSFLANDTFQGPKALVFYAAAICLAAAAGYAVLKGRAIKVNVPALLAWLAFTLVAAATLFFAKDKVTGLFGHRHTESVVFYVAGFFTLLGAMQLEGAQWATILDVVVYQGPIFSLLVLVQSFLQVLTFDYSSSVLTRGDGATGNPVYAAYFLVFAVAATVAALLTAASVWRRVVLSVFLFLELWALAMTDTRSGWVGACAVLIVFFAWAVVQRGAVPAVSRRWKVLVPVCAALFFGVLLVLFNPVLRVSTTLGQAVGETSASAQSDAERIDVWKVAASAFASHPVLGVGADNFATYYVQHVSVSRNPQDPQPYDQAHNLALQILVTTGTVGGACMAAFAWFVLRRSWKILRSDGAAPVAFTAGLVGVLVAAMFNPLDVVSWTFVLVAAGALLCADSKEAQLSGAWWRAAGAATVGLAVVFLLGTVSAAVADTFYQAGVASTDRTVQLADYGRAIAFDPVVPAYYEVYDTSYAEAHAAVPPYLKRLAALEPYSGETYTRNGDVEAYVGSETGNLALENVGLADLRRGANTDVGSAPQLLDAAAWNLVAGNQGDASLYLHRYLALDTVNASAYEALSTVYTAEGEYRLGYGELLRAYLLDPTTSQQLKHVIDRAKLNGYHVDLNIKYEPSAA